MTVWSAIGPVYRLVPMVLLLGALIFLSLNRHSRNETGNYKSEIWADKAGYYVYLPATFIHGFSATSMPDGIDVLTGDGFHLDMEKDVVITKYTAGVAMMQLPFFLAAHLVALRTDQVADGFSLPYHKAIDVAAAWWAFFGMMALFGALRGFFTVQVAAFTVLLLFGGSNLLYYSVIETGMSHVYSFALMSMLIWLSVRITRCGFNVWIPWVFGMLGGLVVAVRPVNALMLPALLLFLPWSVIRGLPWHFWSKCIVAAVLMLLPQLAYWNHVAGSPLHYSYGDEAFSNWSAPRLLSIWFAPHNGLVPYSPVVVVALAGIFLMWRSRQKTNAVLLTAHFLLLSYVFSSWWMWTYGCGLGSRPFVEYLPFLALPLAHVVNHSFSNFSRPLPLVMTIAMLVLIVLAQKLTFSFGLCWYWDDWDWNAYFALLTGPTK
jgi:hypothetical protein